MYNYLVCIVSQLLYIIIHILISRDGSGMDSAYPQSDPSKKKSLATRPFTRRVSA